LQKSHDYVDQHKNIECIVYQTIDIFLHVIFQGLFQQSPGFKAKFSKFKALSRPQDQQCKIPAFEGLTRSV
jgi:hypothetical protein